MYVNLCTKSTLTEIHELLNLIFKPLYLYWIYCRNESPILFKEDINIFLPEIIN